MFIERLILNYNYLTLVLNKTQIELVINPPRYISLHNIFLQSLYSLSQDMPKVPKFSLVIKHHISIWRNKLVDGSLNFNRRWQNSSVIKVHHNVKPCDTSAVVVLIKFRLLLSFLFPLLWLLFFYDRIPILGKQAKCVFHFPHKKKKKLFYVTQFQSLTSKAESIFDDAMISIIYN